MSKEKVLSAKLTLNKYNYKKIIKVAGITALLGAIGSLTLFVTELQLAPQYAFITPMIITLLYSTSEFLREQRGE